MWMARTLGWGFPAFISALLLALAPTWSYAQDAHADRDPCESLLQSQVPPLASALELESRIAESLTEVAEFRFLRETCSQLGVRCWLFGGTAAGFAHYVKWNAQRLAGDTRYQKDRFDFDYTNIYRSTQDADLVIDGTPEQAQELEERLKNRFSHMQGSKSVWEVRLLRTQRGDRIPLLDNPDFSDQHTDSHSTGMIEVSLPPEGESVVRDLRDWEAGSDDASRFLGDVWDAKLHFYFSERHGQTSRARAGLNPPILSVVRYLTKAFQYELEILPEDRARIARQVAEFDAARDLADPYVARWMEKNGPKLFQHAVNLEYAWTTLEELGLRQRLIAISDPAKVGSLGWWLNREPLRSKTVGLGQGRTARELGISVVAHETSDFLAYESITRAHTGDPNVLISRDGKPGETAAHGTGFYTALGRSGARGTGFTIRFEVSPEAREGHDFHVVRVEKGTQTYLVFQNKAALRVIPESLRLDVVSYFEFLTESKNVMLQDKGVLEKFKRRVTARIGDLSQSEQEKLVGIVLASLGRTDGSSRVVGEFVEMVEGAPSSEVLQAGKEKVIDVYVGYLMGPNVNRTTLAAWNLSEHPIRDPRILTSLLFALKKSAGSIHPAETIVSALKAWGPHDEATVQVLRGWLTDPRPYKDAIVLKTAAAEILGSTVTKRDDIAREIAGAASQHRSSKLYTSALKAFRQMGSGDPKVLDEVANWFEYGLAQDYEIFEYLRHAGWVTPRLKELLIARAGKPQGHLNDTALRILGGYCPNDPRVEDLIRRSISSVNPKLQEVAALLTLHFIPADRPWVLRSLVWAVTSGKNPEVRTTAMRTLVNHGIWDESIRGALLEALVHHHPNVRFAAAASLGKLAQPDSRVVSALIRRLSDTSYDVRIYSHDALKKIQARLPEGGRDAQILAGLLQDPQWNQRTHEPVRRAQRHFDVQHMTPLEILFSWGLGSYFLR